jgi:archaellum biogenesis protein FlaJ (TadC family)
MIVFHSLISSIIVKVVDGGSYYSALMDFGLMLWIGAGLSVFIPAGISSMLPSMSSSEMAAELAGDSVVSLILPVT